LEIYLKETATRQLRQKNENVRVMVEGRWNTCRETKRGTTGRSSVAGHEMRRQQGARVVVVGRETRRRWQGARVGVSGGGLVGSRGEKRRQRWRQRNGGSGSTRGGGSGSTELALLEWPELAESGRNLQREMEEQLARARKKGILFLSP